MALPSSLATAMRGATTRHRVASGGATPTWDPTHKGAHVTLSNGNLTATGNSSSFGFVYSTTGYRDTGVDHIVTVTYNNTDAGWFELGFMGAGGNVEGNVFDTGLPGVVLDTTDTTIYGLNGVRSDSAPLINAGDVVRLRLNGTNAYFKINSAAESAAFDLSSISGNIYVVVQPSDSAGAGVTADFSQWAGPAAAVAWTPANLDSGKKVGWFDAQDAATITQSGGLVSAWANKFSGAPLSGMAQASSGVQPTYSASSFNSAYGGLTVTNHYMNATLSTPVANITAIYIMKNAGNGNGAGRFFSFGADADWNYYGALMAVDYGGSGNLFWYGQFNDLGQPAVMPLTPSVVSGTFKTGADDLRLNGSSISTSAATFDFSGATNLRMGNSLQTDGSFGGVIAEVVYLTNATADDIARVEGYAMWRRGLQGTLNAAHPYKSAAPTV